MVLFFEVTDTQDIIKIGVKNEIFFSLMNDGGIQRFTVKIIFKYRMKLPGRTFHRVKTPTSCGPALQECTMGIEWICPEWKR
jgi:hypothetical protein